VAISDVASETKLSGNPSQKNLRGVSAKAAIRHNLLWKCDHPNLVRGGPQSRQRGIGDGDDGSGPRSLQGEWPRLIADMNLKNRIVVIHRRRVTWAGLSLVESAAGSRNLCCASHSD
jgi:hypothetical protein